MNSQKPPLKMGLQRRFVDVNRDAVNEDTRTITVAFSSETPVERFYGNEILDHSPTSVRLGRLNDGGAVLVDHDPTDHVGVVEDVQIDGDRKGRAVLRFGKSQRAQEIWQDVVDGIRRFVSVGYAVHRMVLDEETKDGPDSYRVTDWEPFEISLVAIPADPSVGVGRAVREFDVEIVQTKIEDKTMTEETKQPAVDVRAVQTEARDAERSRVREIMAIGTLHNRAEMAQKAIAEDVSLDDFRGQVLGELAKGQKKVDPSIGMTETEIRQFSFVRAINALANPNDRKAQADAAFEREASEAQAAKLGRASRGITIPHDVATYAKRDLITGTTSATAKGGNLIATDLLAGSFIDVLRNRMVMQQLGATFLTGLQGNIAIPKKTTASTSYWVAENVAPTEGALVFGQVTMSPKTLAAYVDFSRRLSLQSSLDVEALVRNDLATGIAVAVDAAALGASPTSGPVGLRGTSGIGSVAMGTNGLALTWAAIVNLEREVAIDNALTGAASFLSNHKVKAKLATTLHAGVSGSADYILKDPFNSLYGYPFVVSNQVSSTLTKGTSSSVCSAMFFGVWSDLIIGSWSGVDLLVDPYTGSNAGTTRVTAFIDLDIAVRYPESFSACLDVLTT